APAPVRAKVRVGLAVARLSLAAVRAVSEGRGRLVPALRFAAAGMTRRPLFRGLSRRAVVRLRQGVGPGVGKGFGAMGLARVAGLEPLILRDVDQDPGETAVLGDEHRSLRRLLDVEAGAGLELGGGDRGGGARR